MDYHKRTRHCAAHSLSTQPLLMLTVDAHPWPLIFRGFAPTMGYSTPGGRTWRQKFMTSVWMNSMKVKMPHNASIICMPSGGKARSEPACRRSAHTCGCRHA
jgi:hypothetical protein